MQTTCCPQQCCYMLHWHVAIAWQGLIYSASQQVMQTLQNKLNSLIKLNNTHNIPLWYFIRLHISDEQLKRRMLMAVPKKGRLYDQCIRLLERADIKVSVREFTWLSTFIVLQIICEDLPQYKIKTTRSV